MRSIAPNVTVCTVGVNCNGIYSLIPEKLDETINEIEQEALRLMKTYEEYNKSFWMEE